MKFLNFIKLIIILFTPLLIIFFLASCKKFALEDKNEAEKLLNAIYPKKMECDFELVTRYETRESPELLDKYQWKHNNDYLEKMGLIKQLIIDTTINFYDHAHAQFINKHHVLYRIVSLPEMQNLVSNMKYHSKSFDEFDYDNKRTGKQTTMSCKVVCGILTLDKVLNIKQNDPPYASMIEYYEKFAPTAFNDLVERSPKLFNGELLLQNIVAKKYDGEMLKLVY